MCRNYRRRRRRVQRKDSRFKNKEIIKVERVMSNKMLVVIEVPRIGGIFRSAWMGSTAGHLFSNSTNSSSQSYNRNFLRTLNSENMFLKSVLELAVSLALRLCYCKSVTGVPLLIRIESVPKMCSAALRPHRYRHSSTLPTFPLRGSLDLCHPRTILNVKSRKANL